MEHFLKIVHALLDRHAHFKSFNKKTNISSSKPWITAGIAKSRKVKDNLYKSFQLKQICKRKQSTKNNLGPIRTIFPLSFIYLFLFIYNLFIVDIYIVKYQ